jgi:hypothetical protein
MTLYHTKFRDGNFIYVRRYVRIPNLTGKGTTKEFHPRARIWAAALTSGQHTGEILHPQIMLVPVKM